MKISLKWGEDQLKMGRRSAWSGVKIIFKFGEDEREVEWRSVEVSWRSCKVGWRSVKVRCKNSLKWGEDQLNAVKGRELKWGGVWSVYTGSEAEWCVGIGEMCVIECCMVWFTHCLVYLLALNDSSTSGSTRFSVLIVYIKCSWFFFVVILYVEGCLECCVLFCAMCVIVYNTVLSCLAL